MIALEYLLSTTLFVNIFLVNVSHVIRRPTADNLDVTWFPIAFVAELFTVLFVNSFPFTVFSLLDANARSSRDMVVPGLPTWQLWVDVDEFIASHDGWVLQPLLIWMVNSDISPTTVEDSRIVLDNVVNFGGLNSMPGWLSDALDPFFAKDKYVPLGYHAMTHPDKEPAFEIWLLLAVPSNTTVPLRDIFHAPCLLHDEALLTFFGPLKLGDVTVGNVNSLVDRRQSFLDKNKFSLLDDSLGHCWLHNALSLLVDSGDAADLHMRCFTIDPSFVAEYVFSRDAYGWVISAAHEAFKVSSNNLTSAGNEYRSVAGVLLESTVPGLLDSTTRVLLGWE